MEDHKQPGKERKKRSDYFWDFFMLFLAVTAGFFIDNLRESLTEHKREKEFIHSLMSDLQKDADSITAYTQKRDLKNSQCDSLVNQLTTSPADNKAQIYFWGRMATRRNHFYPQDGALQQLKSSGGFRVIHNQRVLDEINAYGVLLKLNAENIDVEEKELTEYSQVTAKLFDARVFQEMTLTNLTKAPAGDPSLLSYDRILINELCIKLLYWKRTSITSIEAYEKIKEKAEKLIGLIKKEYHLSERTPLEK